MQLWSARPGRVLSSLWLALQRGPVDNAAKRSAPDRRRVRIPLLQPTTRGVFARVEYLIRPARITDIERLVALSGESVRAPGGAGSMDSGGLLRQLVYLPQASIFIAEARRGEGAGRGLALRPSVRAGGFHGVGGLVVVDPHHDAKL